MLTFFINIFLSQTAGTRLDCESKDKASFSVVLTLIMAIRLISVVEFSREGYKIR